MINRFILIMFFFFFWVSGSDKSFEQFLVNNDSNQKTDGKD